MVVCSFSTSVHMRDNVVAWRSFSCTLPAPTHSLELSTCPLTLQKRRILWFGQPLFVAYLQLKIITSESTIKPEKVFLKCQSLKVRHRHTLKGRECYLKGKVFDAFYEVDCRIWNGQRHFADKSSAIYKTDKMQNDKKIEIFWRFLKSFCM